MLTHDLTSVGIIISVVYSYKLYIIVGTKTGIKKDIHYEEKFIARLGSVNIKLLYDLNKLLLLWPVATWRHAVVAV